MGIFSKILGGIAGVFVRKVTTTAPDGEEVTRTRPTRTSETIIGLIAAVMAWNYLVEPVLSYHFPHYGFQQIGWEMLTGLFAVGM